MPSPENLILFGILGIGFGALLVYPGVHSAATFVIVTAFYAVLVRFVHETNE